MANRYSQSEQDYYIHEAIDSYPDGLLFASTDGRPILVNDRINDLSDKLLRHTVLDANTFWLDLQTAPLPQGYERLPDITTQAPEDAAAPTAGTSNQLYFQFPNHRVWCFQKTLLDDEEPYAIQIDATDITELYSLSKKLYEDNVRLFGLQARQRDLLLNLVDINQGKEVLSTKMRIHDEVGRCLVATKKALVDPISTEEMNAVITNWEDTIRNLTNIPATNEPEEEKSSPEEELMQIAGIIGCDLEINGDQPTNRQTLLLLYTAIRESLTNAVRHANATRLIVDITHPTPFCHAEISHNGKPVQGPVKEGGGLGDLRKRLEQEGGAMDLKQDGRLTVIVDIPE